MQNLIDVYNKAVKVIKSCKTENQVLTAKTYVELAIKKIEKEGINQDCIENMSLDLKSYLRIKTKYFRIF